MTLELHLVRHGLTPLNAAGVFSGWGDEGLTPLQEEQLLALDFDAGSYDAVYTSPAFRCRETARCLGLSEWVEDPRIAERHFGVFDGLTVARVRETYPEEFARFRALDADFVIPGGESRAQHLMRVRAWLADITDAERVLAITHGGVIDFLYRIGSGLPLHGGDTVFAGSNAALSVFEMRGGEVCRVVEHARPLVQDG